MTNGQHKPRSSLAVWLVAAALLPTAYVLLSGPARWLVMRGYFSNELTACYVPVFRLGPLCPPIRDASQWQLAVVEHRVGTQLAFDPLADKTDRRRAYCSLTARFDRAQLAVIALATPTKLTGTTPGDWPVVPVSFFLRPPPATRVYLPSQILGTTPEYLGRFCARRRFTS
jgi:hypothetical protein